MVEHPSFNQALSAHHILFQQRGLTNVSKKILDVGEAENSYVVLCTSLCIYSRCQNTDVC